MTSDRQFTRDVIASRVAMKARAPYATIAKNALKKGYAKIWKRVGRDVTVMECDSAGNELSGGTWDRLQRGEAITLRAYRQVSQGTHWLFDPDKMKVVGDVTVQINVKGQS